MPRAGARTKRRKLIKIKTRSEPNPNAQKMTNQRSRTKTRAKHKSKKSNLVTVDVSKSSSDEGEDNEVCDSHEHSNKRPSENGVPEESNDLRNKLRQKSHTTDRMHNSKDDLRSIIEESKAKRVKDSSVRPHLKPRVVDQRD
ncbi:hypothetical protein F2Q68_00040215 [Brassica cretica]|uniref:Uncharacterized protein n=1 Tax=Brassica cretica TaxID=69181 RepID=A0A8S9MMR9_BRACR|nr:hypothetical protein F2Q68_00040215 [Brassica cretica]